jgi:uncharacterized protein YbcV (DUF1398 family)
MDTGVSKILHECSRASDEGRESFPVIIGRLMAAGVERYHADLVRSEKTYYLASGDSEIVPNASVGAEASAAFSASGVEAAVRDVQDGTIAYKTFCQRVLAAGCVGYHVSIAGRRVVYYGRTGDNHVEWFPDQKS